MKSPICWFAPVLALIGCGQAAGDFVDLKNGMVVQGKTASIASLGDDVLAPRAGGSANAELIVVVDDGLTRTFVSFYQVANKRPQIETTEKIRLKQPVVLEGNRLGNVGGIVGITPFDDWGRRTFSMLSPRGRIDVIQGITEITPSWTRIQGLRSDRRYVWDMRVATSSIPRAVLQNVIAHHLDMNDPDVRLSLVRLHMQSERYGVAEQELREAIQEFPDLAELKQQLKELRQLRSRQQLDEIKLRRESGQHQLVRALLDKFPDQDVAGEILLEVSEITESYSSQRAQGKRVITSIESQISTLGDQARQETLQAFLREITAELNHSSLPRMADYLRLLDDKDLRAEQKLSLALSGWLLGGTGTENLSVAYSLWRVRDIVQRYLVSTDPAEREQLIAQLASLEGGAPTYVAKILATMRPPVITPGLDDRFVPSPAQPAERTKETDPPSPNDETPLGDLASIERGQFRLETPGAIAGETVVYHVQLPPEYDASRRYPAIVTLHAAGSTPEMQIEWWAGSYDERLKLRTGQATRHGYIVIAPEWAGHRRKEYGYTGREHAAVLYSLRDAMQRFSIDSDRVFLSGHSMGGDAAWDIALAHPDLWAGAIPISAVAGYGRKDSPNYVSRYWKNAKLLPFCFVGGSLDGRMFDLNSRDWNRYLTHTGFDTTVVEYRGRGHEHFQDEIQRLFEWMRYHPRDFFPREFEVTIMRPLDNFFFWVEVDGFPKGSMVLPAQWPMRAVRPSVIEADVREKKNIVLKTGSSQATIWLSPELVDFDGDLAIYVNGKSPKVDISPDVAVLLEDARQRGDRQHPFWARVEVQTGRRPR